LKEWTIFYKVWVEQPTQKINNLCIKNMKTIIYLAASMVALSFFTLSAITITYYYTTPLCLNLVKGEFSAFLANARTQPEEEWRKALKDAILLRDKNMWGRGDSPSIETMLKELQQLLTFRIERIENQLKKKNKFDYSSLTLGALCSVACIGIAALTYYYYKNKYQKNNIEFAQIKSNLERQGVKVNYPWYSDIIELVCPDDPEFYTSAGYRLVKLTNDNQKLLSALGCGIVGSLILSFPAIGGLYQGFYPDEDNEYLPKYKSFLELIEQLIKNGYTQWAIQQNQNENNKS
jgi:hypothetical protein